MESNVARFTFTSWPLSVRPCWCQCLGGKCFRSHLRSVISGNGVVPVSRREYRRAALGLRPSLLFRSVHTEKGEEGKEDPAPQEVYVY